MTIGIYHINLNCTNATFGWISKLSQKLFPAQNLDLGALDKFPNWILRGVPLIPLARTVSTNSKSGKQRIWTRIGDAQDVSKFGTHQSSARNEAVFSVWKQNLLGPMGRHISTVSCKEIRHFAKNAQDHGQRPRSRSNFKCLVPSEKRHHGHCVHLTSTFKAHANNHTKTAK